ncbi:MAG: hypothetical protein ABW174_13065 [Flavitalea sp.]
MSNSNSKPTFYTVFSNSMKPEEYLPNLSEEATKISDLLHGLVFSDAIYYMKDEIFTADRLIANFSKYGDKFDIFYFSGHASDGALKLSDNFITDADRMADVININLKNLQLGFFNACETFDLARKIVDRRVKSNASNRLVMICSGKEINSFFAERFATLFFNHVGRPGTYYDAFKNASTLMSLVNNKLRFREFYDYEELVAAAGDFDYAFIDVPVPEVTSTPAAAPLQEHAETIAIPQPAPVGAMPPPATAIPQPAPAPPPPAAKSKTSIIAPDKKTMDILTANFVKECAQTILNSEGLTEEQKTILTEAIKETQDAVNGGNITAKVRDLWKEAARIVPGIDSGDEFKSLVQVSKKSYNKALDQFYGNAEKQHTVVDVKELQLQD